MQGNLFVAREDDTSGWQEQGRHCDTRQGQGFRSAARNNEAGQAPRRRELFRSVAKAVTLRVWDR